MRLLLRSGGCSCPNICSQEKVLDLEGLIGYLSPGYNRQLTPGIEMMALLRSVLTKVGHMEIVWLQADGDSLEICDFVDRIPKVWLQADGEA